MTVSVLVVDDSGFFRKRLTEILNGVEGIRVIGTASNGREGIEQVARLRPDVVTMDYEMPVMNGIAAVREIMRTCPTPVLMFSSLTYEGARVTLDALEAGAVDFLPKNFEEITSSSSELQRILARRILDVARSRVGQGKSVRPGVSENAPAEVPAQQHPVQPAARKDTRPTPQPQEHKTAAVRQPASGRAPAARPARVTPPASYCVVAIGTSTGGPVALQRVLTRLPANFPVPIVLVQHMPATFTPAFADRLDKMCQIEVRQAENGDELRPGVALLAPGGSQMMVEKKGRYGQVRILPADNRVNYKPSVDITFGSLARAWPGKTLAVILTGMGADGREGCRMMKESGSVVWAQDEKTSVIYGMPMAVAQAGLVDEVLPLDSVSIRLVEAVRA
ncbi:protein-glutamate methylesterase/protein-glutamine glutaminase [Hydrocarboniclastica marina]|uniref:Protein-glutamate methylesterase/protein-glutamine glutaminase n=1 Tax=Hydrocarboniclastica marina TaxID=2259620 RepID=A0A4P7XGD5_9ALTE|nr:chemotaxis response regulator protein-glutamate methylesterase [Hydrocarboniclastica marina]MAL98557.1 chemotaxis response regulator protein-glutamate methylesterase [Alteromonadaceae bacterium]QCF25693.1 chemotaxis response regulator protein-glutamate methylesterase [Hydrocarboniclastica marina]